MICIEIPSIELWDENTNQFSRFDGQKLLLEHSLISISKWESKWHKPYISKVEKTMDETIDYIKCMTVTPNVKPEVYNYLTVNNLEEIRKYISNPMTATKIKNKKESSREQITSELIYYWMFSLNIPMECQQWHLNRLLTLIKIFNIKNTPKEKMSKQEIMRRNAALNAERRKRLNSKG